MKTITVKDETHSRLRNAGISGESMDVIINRALDALDFVSGEEGSYEFPKKGD
jgi:hypothetical protein